MWKSLIFVVDLFILQQTNYDNKQKKKMKNEKLRLDYNLMVNHQCDHRMRSYNIENYVEVMND